MVLLNTIQSRPARSFRPWVCSRHIIMHRITPQSQIREQSEQNRLNALG